MKTNFFFGFFMGTEYVNAKREYLNDWIFLKKKEEEFVCSVCYFFIAFSPSALRRSCKCIGVGKRSQFWQLMPWSRLAQRFFLSFLFSVQHSTLNAVPFCLRVYVIGSVRNALEHFWLVCVQQDEPLNWNFYQ